MSSKAVVEGQLLHCSPSQINTHDRCPRRWYLEKVVGAPRAETAAQARGTQVHKQLEDYYGDGTPPDHPSVVKLLEDWGHMLPALGAPVLIEHPRDYHLQLRASGVSLKGRADLLDLTNPAKPRVIDWKTTSDLKYCKTADDLAVDVQLNVYGHFLFTHFPETREVQYVHGYIYNKHKKDEETGEYYLTKADARVVTTSTLSRDHVLEQFGAIERKVNAVTQTASKTNILDVAGNSDACYDFGPCPFLKNGQCPVAGRYSFKDGATSSTPQPSNFYPTSTEPPAPGETTMSVKERLSKRKATGISPPDAAPVTPQQPPAFAPGKTVSPDELPGRTEEGQRVFIAGPDSPPELDLVLYIDCAPVKGPHASNPQTLEEEVAARAKKVIAQLIADGIAKPGTVDVREVDFGKGTASLMASFRRDPPQGVWVAHHVGLTGMVAEVLATIARLVVRGGR